MVNEPSVFELSRFDCIILYCISPMYLDTLTPYHAFLKFEQSILKGITLERDECTQTKTKTAAVLKFSGPE